MDAAVFAISFLASGIGAICGLGGGIIIKPVMDAFGAWGVSTVNLLSGCVVLAMSVYSVARTFGRGEGAIQLRTLLPLAIGAAVGGLFGKQLFVWVAALFPNPDEAGAVQAAILLAMTALTIAYTVFRERIPSYRVQSPVASAAVGLALGCVSTFLGIGGGPFNLAAFFFLYSMDIKDAAQNSLFVILFSQATAVGAIVAGQGLAGATVPMIFGMIACGIAGGIVGRAINRRIDDAAVNRLFVGLMVVICGICCYNVWRYAIA